MPGENLKINQNSIQEENKCRLKSQNACYHSVRNTIYKTAHLEVFTDYWMYPVSLFVSIFPYSKQKSTYTCCLCKVHSLLKEKNVASTSNCFVAVRTRARWQQLFHHRNNLVASVRLAFTVVAFPTLESRVNCRLKSPLVFAATFFTNLKNFLYCIIIPHARFFFMYWPWFIAAAHELRWRRVETGSWKKTWVYNHQCVQSQVSGYELIFWCRITSLCSGGRTAKSVTSA